MKKGLLLLVFFSSALIYSNTTRCNPPNGYYKKIKTQKPTIGTNDSKIDFATLSNWFANSNDGWLENSPAHSMFKGDRFFKKVIKTPIICSAQTPLPNCVVAERNYLSNLITYV